MIRNTKSQWGLPSRLLHWGIAALIALEVPVGFAMTRAYGASLKDASVIPRLHLLSAIHHTTGLLVLALILGRLSWRLSNVVPARPTERNAALNMLAGLTHASFYLLLVALPLSGYSALATYAEFPIYFGSLHVPYLLAKLPFDDPHGYGFYANIHRWCWTIGGGVLLLHVLAALWHQFVRRDGILRRMWSGASTPG